jgi:hypothetical protein
VGDWNTGAHRRDETGKTYVCAEHFLKLSSMGWTFPEASASQLRRFRSGISEVAASG